MSDASETDLSAKLANLKQLFDQGVLPEDLYRAALKGLGIDPNTVFDLREQKIDEQKNVAGNYYDHSTTIYQSLPPSPTLDADTALSRYLRHVIEANRRLPLQGIRSASGLVSIELEEIYITLTATIRRTVAEEQTWIEEMARAAPDEAEHLGMVRPRETVQQVKVNVQEALADHTRLVVLGDPGCGKTTLLRYLALTFARNLDGEAGLVESRLRLTFRFAVQSPLVFILLETQWPLWSVNPKIGTTYAEIACEEQRLPVLLPLRGFARYLEKHHPDAGTDGPRQMLDFLNDYFANQDIALPERFFADRLVRGECALLLDGADEIADLPMRYRIARIIEQFTIAYPDNRYIVTSRIVGYIDAAQLGVDYAITTVCDFTWNDIERFVAYWNRAVEVTLAGGETPYVFNRAREQATKLLDAIRDNERVRDLAVNPLMLTVIALVQRYRAQLPERRAELYEEAIEVLLSHWDVAKGIMAKVVIAGRELDAGDRRGLLEPVALWMMEQHAREIEADELRRQLEECFLEMTGDGWQAGKAVDEFLRLINERSGLLAERGQGVYAFSHLTFQEHLAARAVADKADYVAFTLARLGDSWWREVILLEAGYLSTQGKQRVTALIQALMDCVHEPDLYHNLVLAAECLRDVGAARVTSDLFAEIQRHIRREFEQPLRKSVYSDQRDLIRRRTVAAEALAHIESGASGTQPAFWRLPYGEPVWVDVPAGEFWIGGDGQYDSQPVHRLHLDSFQIARVPVTNVQYRFFVEAKKYHLPGHWHDGKIPRELESHPIVNVSWHDAMEYCRWLSEMTGKPVTLPSEAQWEKAARGNADKRAYPWGNEWDETKCNTSDLGISGTTPVGIFPDGVSPYGCLDMIGNVWEWTISLWGKGVSKPDFKYPYSLADGRENPEADGKVLRVVRGGSFVSARDFCRCAYRNRYFSHINWNYYGFRVAISFISPNSAL